MCGRKKTGEKLNTLSRLAHKMESTQGRLILNVINLDVPWLCQEQLVFSMKYVLELLS